MRTYRCFTLNKMGLIARREDIEAPDDNAALEEGWRRVTTHQHDEAQTACGLELWLGLTLIFTTRNQLPVQRIGFAAGDSAAGDNAAWDNAAGDNAETVGEEWRGFIGADSRLSDTPGVGQWLGGMEALSI